MKTIQDVIDAELTFVLEHLVLCCVTAKLGDIQNGYTDVKVCGSYAEAEAFIIDAANRLVQKRNPTFVSRPTA